jgi:2'-5' RNA ligase
VRAFFAVELTDPARRAIAERVQELAQALPGVHWTQSESYHVTLKFLGEIAEQRAGELAEAAAAKLSTSRSFTAALGGFGAFPSARAARVAWVGVASGSAALARIAHKLDAAAARFGTPRERRAYHAHVTVGRLREAKPIALERFTAPLGVLFPVAEVVLFESRLSPAGSRYVPCARLALASEAGEPRELDELAPEI